MSPDATRRRTLTIQGVPIKVVSALRRRSRIDDAASAWSRVHRATRAGRDRLAGARGRATREARAVRSDAAVIAHHLAGVASRVTRVVTGRPRGRRTDAHGS